MNSENETCPTIDKVMSDINSGKLSLFDFLMSVPNGDYRAHVNAARLFYAMSTEPTILRQFSKELTTRLLEAGGDPSDKSIAKELLRKDGHRRFSKLVEVRTEMFGNQPLLLSGNTFDECLTQYKSVIGHVETLWNDASRLYLSESYSLAAFISVVTIEEIGKLANLAQELIFYDVPRDSETKKTMDRNHRKKQFYCGNVGSLNKLTTRSSRRQGCNPKTTT